jgi:type IV secretion system protein VirD4
MTANTALLRMWIASLLRAVVRGGLQEKRLVRVLLDESASLGHMDIIDDAVDKFRGYGIRLFFLFQSLGQTKKCFPDGQEQTFLSNVTQIFAGVNDNETAKYISERLGKSTIVTESGGTGTSCQTSSQQGQGGGSSSYSSGRSSSDNWQQSGRELLQPNEVMNLHDRVAIIFTPGIPPLWTTLVRYYEAGFMKRTARFWPAVKAFAGAVFILIVMAACAGLLTLAVNEKCHIMPVPACGVTQWLRGVAD